jgi:hypothetical protein
MYPVLCCFCRLIASFLQRGLSDTLLPYALKAVRESTKTSQCRILPDFLFGTLFSEPRFT